MIDKLESLSARLRELDAAVAEPGLAKDPRRYRELMRERSRLAVIDRAFEDYKSLLAASAGARELVSDESDTAMRDLAREELRGLDERKAALEARLQELIAPRDSLADKPAIMEIEPAREARKPRSSPPTSSACIPAMPTAAAGR